MPVNLIHLLVTFKVMIFTDGWKLALNREILSRIVQENSEKVRKLILITRCKLNDNRDTVLSNAIGSHVYKIWYLKIKKFC